MSDDPHDLRRFVDAQSHNYDQALAEIGAGQKRSHWMWYVFPQYEGLGHSPTTRRYSIKSVAEANAYLRHPILGARLMECAEALLRLEGRTAHEIFGSPDDAKLQSSATLFSRVAPAGSAFHRILERYFAGEPDRRTLELIGIAAGLSLTLLTASFALCRLGAADPVPEWTTSARAFLSITRSPGELSIVADDAAVPSHVDAARGYRALRVDGPMPLELVGVMAAIANPLAAAGVPIFPIATYDTDYVLIPGDDLSRAISALGAAGHCVAVEGER